MDRVHVPIVVRTSAAKEPRSEAGLRCEHPQQGESDAADHGEGDADDEAQGAE